MSTITSREIIYEMLINNGAYIDDPLPDSIWQYESQAPGQDLYKLIYSIPSLREFLESPYVVWRLQLWSKSQGLTDVGHDFINEYEMENPPE